MKHRVKLPKLGDTADEVVVLEWLVNEGSSVAAGDPVLVVETNKAEAEVVSPVAGVVVSQLVALEEEVSIGTALFVVESS